MRSVSYTIAGPTPCSRTSIAVCATRRWRRTFLPRRFAVAYERSGHFRDVGKPGGAWLYGIARRELSHYFRRSRVQLDAARRLGIEVPELDHDSVAAIEALEAVDAERARLTEAIARLSVSERDAVQLRVVGELDYGEIASRLRCSEAAARTRVHRGLARLSELMEARS